MGFESLLEVPDPPAVGNKELLLLVDRRLHRCEQLLFRLKLLESLIVRILKSLGEVEGVPHSRAPVVGLGAPLICGALKLHDPRAQGLIVCPKTVDGFVPLPELRSHSCHPTAEPVATMLVVVREAAPAVELAGTVLPFV